MLGALDAVLTHASDLVEDETRRRWYGSHVEAFRQAEWDTEASHADVGGPSDGGRFVGDWDERLVAVDDLPYVEGELRRVARRGPAQVDVDALADRLEPGDRRRWDRARRRDGARCVDRPAARG